MPGLDASVLNADLLRRIAGTRTDARAARQAAIIAEIGPLLAPTLATFSIDTPLRAAHFLAQTCVESDRFSTTTEYADGSEYNGRTDLGNTQPGDGPRYKGRGLIQLTGRANYAQYGTLLGLDLLGNPALAEEGAVSLRIACEYWTLKTLNVFADWDDALVATYRINGGFNGLVARLAALASAKAALGIAVPPAPTLRQGDSGPEVMSLQAGLRWRQMQSNAAMTVGVDGGFGAGTAAAVKQFQQASGLVADGVVGPQVWAALRAPAG